MGAVVAGLCCWRLCSASVCWCIVSHTHVHVPASLIQLACSFTTATNITNGTCALFLDA